MAIKLRPRPSLNLHLEGSIGTFRVGDIDKNSSLEVKYFLTHVSLDLAGDGQNERLLRQLCLVREIFDINQQKFDEMMQRDIDDARVSHELIPYILNSSQAGTIKFFPPIVVMCLPFESHTNHLIDFYPKRFTSDMPADENSPSGYFVDRSGAVGAEVFEFKQPIHEGKKLSHDLARLSINTSKTKLIIVDGQHRAMALLALYRNLSNDWSDAKRRPFQSYYSEWSPEYIRGFDLKDIQLPIILCTIPKLDDTYTGDYNLKKAARSIFLTLNKNARPVTKTRNMLLDDNDIISSFMRSTLSKIKNNDERSNTALDIYCIELDQDGDKQKISNPLALSAVNHFYYMIEHLMLNNKDDIKGISTRSGRFTTRIANEKVKSALNRLDCHDKLGTDALQTIRRDFFTNEQENQLSKIFEEKYGYFIVKMFSEFKIFSAHNNAAEKLRREVDSHSDVHLKPMLFEGQGMIRTFETHRENLNEKLKNGYFQGEVPKITSLSDQLNATNESLKKAVENFKEYRAKEFLSGLPTSQTMTNNKIKHILRKFIDDWYSNIFTSVAFQSAVICGFFYEIEKIIKPKEFNNRNTEIVQYFENYLQSIEHYFVPQTIPRLGALISLLSGRVDGTTVDDFQNISNNSADTFRSVVFPGEMQPDAWPAYKYLLCEIWEKKLDDDNELKQSLTDELKLCRDQIKNNLHEKLKNNYKKEKNIPTNDELSKEVSDELWQQMLTHYKQMLSCIEKKSVI